MRGFIVGSVMVLIAAILVPILQILDVPRQLAVGISIGIAFLGFAIQLWSAFSYRRKFDRDMREREEAHRAHLAHVATLPPDEAIKQLLRPK